ncbi:MAG TPA: hypothetical protein VFC58_07460 [Desulfosporosinus sp.]|nr:hypothetical protein [Desulfosporosinus sp.]
MDKEELERKNEEGKNMRAARKESEPSFADFINSNKNVIRKIVGANSTNNRDGLAVITKDDPWRDESEWDQLDRDLKDR